MKNTNSLGKEERLCSRKQIADLFESGNSIYPFPFSIVWKQSSVEFPFPVKIAFSVSKKAFKRAVDRNRIKRLLREAWRLNKSILYEELEQDKKYLVIMLIYNGKAMPDFETITKSLLKAIEKISVALHETKRKD